MARVPNCGFKVDGCDDPRCSRSLCIQQKEADAIQAARDANDAARVHRQALLLAELAYELKGVSLPSQAQINEYAQRPDVRKQAKKHLDVIAAALRSRNSN